jgi:plasmid stabilization system protein ParE
MSIIIRWNQNAIRQFEKAIAYIENDSVANAEKFKVDMLNKIDGLLTHPERYSPDKYKVNNDGTFRAFELHSYRLSFRHKGKEIRIIRLRHTKMNPVNY